MRMNKISERKIIKVLKEMPSIITAEEFKSHICNLCPYKCSTCVFCKSFFDRFAKSEYFYDAMYELLNIMISSFYSIKTNFVITCYFLEGNICPICRKFSNIIDNKEYNECSSKYLVQMSSCKKYNYSEIVTDNTDMISSQFIQKNGKNVDYIDNLNDSCCKTDLTFLRRYYRGYYKDYEESEPLPLLTVSKDMAIIINNLWNYNRKFQLKKIKSIN